MNIKNTVSVDAKVCDSAAAHFLRKISEAIRRLSSRDLLDKTQELVSEERRITLQLIEHLREIDRRLLFAELGYGSLFEFATKYLGLSEGAAQRRIQAMRLVRDVPEAKAALESGELSLSNAAKVQAFFQMEKKQGRDFPVQTVSHLVQPESGPIQQNPLLTKSDILKQIQGLSQRECEQKLYEISPQSIPRERERVVSAQERELKIVVSEETYQKLQQLKGLLAHSMPEANYAELIEYMADAALSAAKKKKGLPPECSHLESPDQPTSNHTAAVQTEKFCSENTSEDPEKLSKLSLKLPLPGVRGHIPVSMQRAVWARANGRCEYEGDAKKCSSQHRLEIDHQTPLALGGANDLANLRLLCRTHNAQQARAKLGVSPISFAT